MVGAHGKNFGKVCIPKNFVSNGCCSEGVDIWAIGEDFFLTKTKEQEKDTKADGTCVSAAVVAGFMTHLMTTVCKKISYHFDKSSISKTVKDYIKENCSKFHCSEHNSDRNLILDANKWFEKL